MNPGSLTNLIEMLAWRAEVSAGKAAFTFSGMPCTFEELWLRSNRFASYLRGRAIKRQECVLIVLPNSPEFFFAFYGVQRAGGIAVPIFPHSGWERILAIAEASRARIIVVPANIPAEKMLQINKASVSRGLSVVTVDEGPIDLFHENRTVAVWCGEKSLPGEYLVWRSWKGYSLRFFVNQEYLPV